MYAEGEPELVGECFGAGWGCVFLSFAFPSLFSLCSLLSPPHFSVLFSKTECPSFPSPCLSAPGVYMRISFFGNTFTFFFHPPSPQRLQLETSTSGG
ncbi:hypothetical protein B0H13DRAFT_2657145 [Mycena leptocephala]|nr:hypothetical protein B0H13DRAFT_2657145 [Mycena leptocephala]